MTLFQFHKGTIRTLLLRNGRRLHLDFNSIKVRLEQGLRPERRIIPAFQFHKGTIRTECFCATSNCGGHFNSIKVRLEQAASSGCTWHLDFNSIKVRLELSVALPSKQPFSCISIPESTYKKCLREE